MLLTASREVNAYLLLPSCSSTIRESLLKSHPIPQHRGLLFLPSRMAQTTCPMCKLQWISLSSLLMMDIILILPLKKPKLNKCLHWEQGKPSEWFHSLGSLFIFPWITQLQSPLDFQAWRRQVACRYKPLPGFCSSDVPMHSSSLL